MVYLGHELDMLTLNVAYLSVHNMSPNKYFFLKIISLTGRVVGVQYVDKAKQRARDQVTERLKCLLLVGLIIRAEKLRQCHIVKKEGNIILSLRAILPPPRMEQNIEDISVDIDSLLGPLFCSIISHQCLNKKTLQGKLVVPTDSLARRRPACMTLSPL